MADRPVYESLFKATVQKILTIMKNRDIPTSQLKETDELKVLTTEERKKIDKITTTGNGSKFLASDGTYKESLTTDQATKLSKLVIDGDGTKVLTSDGTYKANAGLTEEQAERVAAIDTSGNGSKYLANDGTYVKINADNVVNGTTNKVYTKEEQEKVSKLVIDGDGTKVLADDGTYINPSAVGVIDDTATSLDTTYSSEKIESELALKAKSNHTHSGLEDAHKHDNKTTLDKIDDTFYDKTNKLVTNIINPNSVGDGTKILYNDYTFKELDLSEVTKDAIEAIGEHPIDVVNEDEFKIEEIADPDTAEMIKQLSLTHPIKVLTNAQYVDLKTNNKLDNNTLYITVTEATDEEGSRVDVLSLILTSGDGNKFLSDDGKYKEININIDDIMSDDSENPVQNKVVKTYVDEAITTLSEYVNEKEVVISEEIGNQIVVKADGIYVGKEEIAISAETDNMLERKSDGLYVQKVDASVSVEAGNIIEKKTDGLYATVTISADETNVLSAKSDGLYVPDIVISTADNNAIVEKEDGWYVEDKTEDIAKLRADVDPIKKYNKYVNTELDSAYCILKDNYKTTAGTYVPFVKQSGNMNVSNGLVTVKPKQRIEMTIHTFYVDTAGTVNVNYHIKDKTNDVIIGQFNPYDNGGTHEYNKSCSIQYTNESDEDIEIGLYIVLSSETDILRSDFSCMIVKEIGRALTIDPVEHINTTSGLEDLPIGHMIDYMGFTSPKHYLICDGTEYKIKDYLHLAEHFREQYGSYNVFGGDGETTFAVPDTTIPTPIEEKWEADSKYVFEGTGAFSVVERTYYKKNAGKAIVAVITNAANRGTWPCIISTNPDYTAVYCSYNTGQIDTNSGQWGSKVDYLGFTWYITFSQYGWTDYRSVSGFAPTIDGAGANVYGSVEARKTVALKILEAAGVKEAPIKPAVFNCIKYEPTYFMNVFGLRTETVLWEGFANAGNITLADNIKNYDEFAVYSTQDNYRQNYRDLHTTDEIKDDYDIAQFICHNKTIDGYYLLYSFANEITLRIDVNHLTGLYINKVVGIKYGTTTEGNAPTIGGSCDCETYTDEQITESITDILETLNSKEEE